MTRYSKKILSFVLTFIMLVNVAAIACSASNNNLPDINGTGTENDPYQIGTVAQLEYMRSYSNKHFILVDDISVGTFDPIDYFSGTLDGDGHTLYYVTIDETDNYSDAGFFRTLAVGSEVSNLHLKYHSVRSNQYAGGLCATLAGTVDQVYLEGGCSIESVLYDYVAGGLCAVAESTAVITNCYIGSGTHVAADIAGGIAGISKSASIANAVFLGGVHRTRGPYSTVGTIFGKLIVNKVDYSAEDINWDIRNARYWDSSIQSIGTVQKIVTTDATGYEGIVGIYVPDETVTVGESKTLSSPITEPAGATLNGSWYANSAYFSLTPNGTLTGLSAGSGVGYYVMPFYGSVTVSYEFDVTVNPA